MVYAGMGPDYRVLVDKARKVSHSGYKRIYNEYPPTRILVQDVARVMQEATQSGGVRPYGVSLLVAGWDEGVLPDEELEKLASGAAGASDSDSDDEMAGEKKKLTGKTGGILRGGPMLYQVDPSGSYFPWKATAIGKSATSAKTFLEKRYTDGLELEDAVHIALLTLKEHIEGEMSGDTIEIGEFAGPPRPPLDSVRTVVRTLLFWPLLFASVLFATVLTVVLRYRRSPSRPSPGHRGGRGSARAEIPKVDAAGNRRLHDQLVDGGQRGGSG